MNDPTQMHEGGHFNFVGKFLGDEGWAWAIILQAYTYGLIFLIIFCLIASVHLSTAPAHDCGYVPFRPSVPCSTTQKHQAASDTERTRAHERAVPDAEQP